jgi:hypothetical protein
MKNVVTATQEEEAEGDLTQIFIACRKFHFWRRMAKADIQILSYNKLTISFSCCALTTKS